MDPRRNAFIRRSHDTREAIGREGTSREPSPSCLAHDARLVDGRKLDELLDVDTKTGLLRELTSGSGSFGLPVVDSARRDPPGTGGVPGASSMLDQAHVLLIENDDAGGADDLLHGSNLDDADAGSVHLEHRNPFAAR